MTRLTNRQVDLLEQLDDFIEWIECLGRIEKEDVSYLQELLDNLANTISKSEEENELAEKCPWPEGD